MALFEAEQVMIRLMILYGCAVIFGFLASVPMIYHVSPISECLLFSTVARSGKLFYGHYASKYKNVLVFVRKVQFLRKGTMFY